MWEKCRRKAGADIFNDGTFRGEMSPDQLVSSAKSSFDAMSSEVTRVSSEIILLDRTLALYGPETNELRNLLRSSVGGVVARMEAKKSANPSQLRTPTREGDGLYDKIQTLTPKDDRQRSSQARA